MGDLSENFDRSEFECRCGCGFSSVDPRLIEGLQKLRNKAKKAVHVNCGCRCKTHNRAVGGVRDSQHLYGRAADIWIEGMTPVELSRMAMQIPEFRNGGIGVYSTFVHVDVRGYPARWRK